MFRYCSVWRFGFLIDAALFRPVSLGRAAFALTRHIAAQAHGNRMAAHARAVGLHRRERFDRDHFGKRFAGEPLKPLALTFDGKTLRGEAMITRDGIEGGAIYALSAPLRETIARDGQTTLVADLRPDLPLETLAQRLAAPRKGRISQV